MEAPGHQHGAGETITDRPGRRVVLAVGLAELAVTESWYGPGEMGPAPHVHRQHEDCFWVLDGELVFELGPQRDRLHAAAGDFVLIPRGVAHAFGNGDAGTARFLNLHAPSAGFHDYLRSRSSGAADDGALEEFDTFDPPPGGGRAATAVLVRHAGDGERVRMRTSTAIVVAGRDDGTGSITVLDTMLEPGFDPPPMHRHARSVEALFVLEGVLAVRVGDETIEVGPGGRATVPPGTVHTIANPGSARVRVLVVNAPGGLEGYLRAVAAAAAGEPGASAGLAAAGPKFDFIPVA